MNRTRGTSDSYRRIAALGDSQKSSGLSAGWRGKEDRELSETASGAHRRQSRWFAILANDTRNFSEYGIRDPSRAEVFRIRKLCQRTTADSLATRRASNLNFQHFFHIRILFLRAYSDEILTEISNLFLLGSLQNTEGFQ